ncbi:MAG: hypothetical protein ABSE73_09835 [Planctomycetota bacterium]
MDPVRPGGTGLPPSDDTKEVAGPDRLGELDGWRWLETPEPGSENYTTARDRVIHAWPTVALILIFALAIPVTRMFMRKYRNMGIPYPWLPGTKQVVLDIGQNPELYMVAGFALLLFYVAWISKAGWRICAWNFLICVWIAFALIMIVLGLVEPLHLVCPGSP